MSKKTKPIEHEAYGLPGNLIAKCENCESLRKQVLELQEIINNVSKLALWYESNVNSSITAHRIHKALGR